MIRNIIVGVIILLAASYIANWINRGLRGKGKCGSCGKAFFQCPGPDEHPARQPRPAKRIESRQISSAPPSDKQHQP